MDTKTPGQRVPIASLVSTLEQKGWFLVTWREHSGWTPQIPMRSSLNSSSSRPASPAFPGIIFPEAPPSVPTRGQAARTNFVGSYSLCDFLSHMMLHAVTDFWARWNPQRQKHALRNTRCITERFDVVELSYLATALECRPANAFAIRISQSAC